VLMGKELLGSCSYDKGKAITTIIWDR